MRTVTVKVEGITLYSASKPVETNLQVGETHDEHERRRWREKAHTTPEGRVYIPGENFKLALDTAASLLGEKIKGKGNQTWPKQFRAGVTNMGDLDLGVQIDDVNHIAVYCHSDGKREGKAGRVWRYFPFLPTWKGEIKFAIFNDQITPDVFERFFTAAGVMAGVGRGRPSTGCAAGNGRFKPTSFVWAEE